MKIINVLVACVLILSLTACEKDALPGIYQVAYQQSVSLKNSNVLLTFAELLEESRCPADEFILCVWEGQVRVLLTLSEGEQLDSLELIYRSTDPELAKGEYKDLTIELVKVTPEKTTSSRVIPPEEYRLELKVDKN